MPRLLSDSDGFEGVTGFVPVSGPNARNSGSTTAMDGTEQTFDAYGDVVALQFSLNIKKDRGARRLSGMLTALKSGNAMRLRFFDPDMISPAEAGLAVGAGKRWPDLAQQDWSNGEAWSNGEGWHTSAEVVPVAAATALDGGIVQIEDEHWGHSLGLGDRLGFLPFHFGLYTITEVIVPGTYRMWPRLRKALAYTGDPDEGSFATLFPTIVMRPAMSVMPPARGLAFAEAASVTMVEVPDYYVRDYYED